MTGGWKSRLCSAARQPEGKALLTALLTLAVLLPVWWLATQWYGDRLLAQERADAALETSLRANALSSVINRRLARLQGLYAFVQVEGSEDYFSAQFRKFAAGLHADTRGIRSLAVAPGGIVRYVYPLAGNESIVGYDPANDPRAEVRAGVQRAIETQEIALTGPLELLDGTQGLIARQAVYQRDTYWGFVSMVLDMPTMLAEAGLSDQPGGLDFALRGETQVFYERALAVFEVHHGPDHASTPIVRGNLPPRGLFKLFNISTFLLFVHDVQCLFPCRQFACQQYD